MELLKHMLMTITKCLPVATDNLIDGFEKVICSAPIALRLQLELLCMTLFVRL